MKSRLTSRPSAKISSAAQLPAPAPTDEALPEKRPGTVEHKPSTVGSIDVLSLAPSAGAKLNGAMGGPSIAWPVTATLPPEVKALFGQRQATHPLAQKTLEKHQTLHEAVQRLTTTELWEARQLALGKSEADIAEAMGVHPSSVSRSVSVLLFKLGAKNVCQGMQILLAAKQVDSGKPTHFYGSLSAAAQAVLRLMAQGVGLDAIAHMLQLKQSEVNEVVAQVRTQWGAANDFHLRVMAVQSGLLPPLPTELRRLGFSDLPVEEREGLLAIARGEVNERPGEAASIALEKLSLNHLWQAAAAILASGELAEPPSSLAKELLQLGGLDRLILELLASGWGSNQIAAHLDLRTLVLVERVNAMVRGLKLDNPLRAACVMGQLRAQVEASEVPASRWEPHLLPPTHFVEAFWRLSDIERAYAKSLMNGVSAKQQKQMWALTDATLAALSKRVQHKMGVYTPTQLALRGAQMGLGGGLVKPARLSIDDECVLQVMIKSHLQKGVAVGAGGEKQAFLLAQKKLGFASGKDLSLRLREIGGAFRVIPDSPEGLRRLLCTALLCGVGSVEVLEPTPASWPWMDAMVSSEEEVLGALAQGMAERQLPLALNDMTRDFHGEILSLMDQYGCDEPHQLIAVATFLQKIQTPISEEQIDKATRLPEGAKQAFISIAAGRTFECTAERMGITKAVLRSLLLGPIVKGGDESMSWIAQAGLRTEHQIPGLVVAAKWPRN